MAVELRCSFCNRSEQEGERFFSTPGVRICVHCVILCRDLLAPGVLADRAKPRRSVPETIPPEGVDRAIAELRTALDASPDDVSKRLKLGDLLARKGDTTDAAQQYQWVAERFAADGTPLKAVAVYKQLLKLGRSDARIHLRLAELYLRVGLVADAEKCVEAARSAEPDAATMGGVDDLQARITAATVPREEAKPPREWNPHCSFCSKGKSEVETLIAGPMVYICAGCVSRAVADLAL